MSDDDKIYIVVFENIYCQPKNPNCKIEDSNIRAFRTKEEAEKFCYIENKFSKYEVDFAIHKIKIPPRASNPP
jgi:hypothetical protein